MKLYEEYENALRETCAEGKKMRGALFAECVKREIQKKLNEDGIDDYVVSDNNVYIKGSSYEYDLLIVKKECNVEYGIVYDPADVIACIECKAAGLYNPDTDSTAIANAYNRLYELNNDIYFGYITLWENKPVNKIWKGKTTVDHWELTQEYLEEKLASENQVVYAVTLRNGDNIIGPSESEFTEFVGSLIGKN